MRKIKIFRLRVKKAGGKIRSKRLASLRKIKERMLKSKSADKLIDQWWCMMRQLLNLEKQAKMLKIGK